MKNQSEVFHIFQKIYAKIETQFGVSITCFLRSENAKEFFSSSFVDFMYESVIVHQSWCSYTQHNKIAECKNRYFIRSCTHTFHSHKSS